MLVLDMIYVDWIVKKEKKKNLQVLWDVFPMLWTLWGLGRDRNDPGIKTQPTTIPLPWLPLPSSLLHNNPRRSHNPHAKPIYSQYHHHHHQLIWREEKWKTEKGKWERREIFGWNILREVRKRNGLCLEFATVKALSWYDDTEVVGSTEFENLQWCH